MPNRNTFHVKLAENHSREIKEFKKREWPIADKEHYGKPISSKTNHTFVAKTDEGEIAGILDLTIEMNLAFIEDLLVGSKHRQQGIGKQLVQEAESFARKKKCTKIYLETNEGWGAVEFYKKSGYTVTGKHERHILGQTTLIFTKFL